VISYASLLFLAAFPAAAFGQCDRESCACIVTVTASDQPPYECPDWMQPQGNYDSIYGGLLTSDCVSAKGGAGQLFCFARTRKDIVRPKTFFGSCNLDDNTTEATSAGVHTNVAMVEGDDSDPTSTVLFNYTEADPAPECQSIPPFSLATDAPTTTPTSSTGFASAKRAGCGFVAAASSIALAYVFA